MSLPKIQSDYLSSLIFGVEDGLVSTTGVVIGVAVGAQSAQIVILAGLVAVAVEAFSMAAGQFLSHKTVHELHPTQHADSLAVGAIIMFLAYLGAGLLLVLPYIFFELVIAITLTFLLAGTSLFALGYLKAKFTRVSAMRSGVEMLLIGGVATLVGLIVGLIFKA